MIEELILPETDKSGIRFNIDGGWIMQITEREGVKKIKFNTKDHPDLAEDDFANRVIEILQNNEYL